MGRRRKSGNKLLGRILLVSVAAHVVIVPILAKMGTFDRIKRQFAGPTVTVLPPAEKVKEVAPKAQPKKASAVTKRTGSAVSHAAKSSLSQPHVIASTAPQGGTDSGPEVDPNGSGKAGVVPTTQPSGQGTIAGGTDPSAHESEKKPAEKEPADTVEKPKEPETKPAEAIKADKPHVPVLVAAVATYRPEPEIPDEFRSEELDKTTTVLLEILPDGTVGDVNVQSSCGVEELDSVAVNAAKRWKFQPATKDGEPIKSHVRLHVQFKVDQ